MVIKQRIHIRDGHAHLLHNKLADKVILWLLHLAVHLQHALSRLHICLLSCPSLHYCS